MNRRAKKTLLLALGICLIVGLGVFSWYIYEYDGGSKPGDGGSKPGDGGSKPNPNPNPNPPGDGGCWPTGNDSCSHGFAACKMSTVFPGFGSVPAPMFLNQTFKRLRCISDYFLPFGIKHDKEHDIVKKILSATNNYGLGEELDSLKKKNCIVVGNGGILTNKALGQTIDKFDVVVRINAAPVKGYEKDVGNKTTMRILYPESCPKNPEEIESQSLFVLLAFKEKDLQWFKHMVFKEKLPDTLTFWQPVAQNVPREPADMRILNPYFIREVAFKLIGLPYNDGRPVWNRDHGNIPTTGAVAITLALHNCENVSVAGFGYNMSDPHAPLHYYNDGYTMSEVTERGNHNIVKEKQFLAKVLNAGAIQDLTNGIID